ncbi:MAG: hypothetical protein FI708_12080 [SAR202 cluster bacterium]|uniref:Cytochrome c domain-containing protein n=1 Tax=hydrothermal vent metagenome TaxID=652676 RepID=A0A160V707_9ZZZZ|nr:hypothetical protein [Dehalococcoidia bacterium]MQF92299.1 hypothetical protein [SAR202 cluster bacterium]MQG63470.1 hypothetical protein [SAR202 cluster bacterium]MQG71510.1 hypothetical protein [SAR202 cluster bacterium]|tara:strand:- start:1778 stop:2119 length:342 start_codon:yes stop_codon:yes gene_type:complete
MSEDISQEQVVYWPRVKEILDGIMGRWIERWDRQPLPGIHAYYWETAEDIQAAVLSGLRAIEPGLPARETNLVKSLARAVGTSGKMPLRGPFLSTEEVDEVVAWIDGGMPGGP